MAYDEFMADRLRQSLQENRIDFLEKKMMGGLCFMVDGKMCMGLVKDKLMARIGPDRYEEALKMDHCQTMDFTGRAMKGYVFIDPEGLQEEQLNHWVQWCLDFNPLAKASKKRRKK